MKVLRDRENNFFIVKKEEIEEIELSEAYDSNGVKWGEEYEGYFAKGITYHDGNWRTLFVGESEFIFNPALEYIDEDEEEEILTLFEECKNEVEENKCYPGVKSIEYKGYTFHISNWADDSWNIARVDKN